MTQNVEILSRPPAPFQLADPNCLLFAYGQLQPGQRPLRSLVRAWPDQVRGLLYDLGPYPAAVRIGSVDEHFHGYVLEIALAELMEELDPFEQVDEGLYRRIQVVTQSGFTVWVYEYARSLGDTAIGPIDRWPLECGNESPHSKGLPAFDSWSTIREKKPSVAYPTFARGFANDHQEGIQNKTKGHRTAPK